MINNIYKSLILVALCTFVASCNVNEKIEPENGGKTTDGKSISFAIGGAETKSAMPSHSVTAMTEAVELDCVEGLEGLLLTEEVSSMDAIYAPTKGTPVYTENIEDIYDKLAVTAYKGNTVWNGENVIFDYERDESGAKVYSHRYNVDLEDGLQFFIKAPYNYSNNSIAYDTSNGSISFSYESPLTAADQKDLLFSSKTIEKVGDSNRVLLYHALTAVKFKISSSTGKKVTLESITKVEFNGLYSKGDCVVTPSFDGDSFNQSNQNAGTEKSADTVAWSNRSDNTKVISQTFTGDDAKGRTLAGNYPTSFFEGTTEEKNINAADASLTFMLIPQEITNGVTLTIEYTYADGDVKGLKGKATINFGEKLSKSGKYEWKAGELRTYSISLDDEVKVHVDDEVNTTSHTKSNLQITNTGTATAYMRVAVIGNWFTVLSEDEKKAGIPVAITPCSNLATVVDPAMNSNWFKGTDGYYYYKYPVLAGHTIASSNTLFSTLNLASLYTSSKPYNNCELRITVAVQAIRANDVATWTETSGKIETEANESDI